MIYIAHRGNVDGPDPEQENEPAYIDLAIKRGYAAEVDLWIREGDPWLGHDEPQYQVSEDWLIDRARSLWIHCKNIEALCYMGDVNFRRWQEFDYFWHQEDDYTVTSNGLIWAYPGKSLNDGRNIICVMPERANYTLEEMSRCFAICSDEVSKLDKGEWK